MKYFFLFFLLFTGCATAVEAPSVKSKNAFSSFAHLQKKKTAPFKSTFLNPVFKNQKKKKIRTSVSEKGPIQSAAYLWFALYQNTLSRLDGATCNFSPTCSAYTLHAISKYGVLGLGLAFGRLHKNHLDDTFYRQAPPRLSDPLTNYTFWLQSAKVDDFSAHIDPAHAWFQHVSLVDE